MKRQLDHKAQILARGTELVIDHARRRLAFLVAGLAAVGAFALPAVVRATHEPGNTISVVEGAQFSGVVAKLTSPSSCDCVPGSASIAWGDGTTTAGTFDGSTISGSHTYAEAGSYPVSATAHGSSTPCPPTTDTCFDPGPYEHTFNGTANVTEAPLSATGTTFATQAGQPFSGLVAHFTDANSLSKAGDFITTIRWGDGQTSTDGTITGADGQYDVSGSHTYASSGTYPVTVEITEVGQSTTATGTANVAGPTTAPGTANVPGPTTAPGTGGAPTISVKTGISKTLGKATWISAAGSMAVGGKRVVKLEWDLNGDGKFRELTCGEGFSAVSHPFGSAGVHMVGVRITDSAGSSAVQRFPVNVPATQLNNTAGAALVAACENPGGNNQPDSSDCVKTFAFNLIEANSRGKAEDCFQVETDVRGRTTASTSAVPKGPTGRLAVRTCYIAKLKGAVSVNGLYVPLPESSPPTEYNECDNKLGLGSQSVDIGRYELARVDLDFPEPEYGLKGRHRVGQARLSGLSDLFGFKIGGKVTVDLTYHAAEIVVHVDLPNIFNGGAGQPAQGDLTLQLDNQSNGVRLDHLRIAVPTLFLGALEIDNFFIEYMRATDTWDGGGDLKFGPTSPFTLKASPPPPDNGFGLKRGKFSHAGAELQFSAAAAPQVFPGVFLSKIAFSVHTSPTVFRGKLAMNVGKSIEVQGDMFLAFATPSEPYEFPAAGADEDLAPLGGKTFDKTALGAGGVVYVVAPVLGRIPLASAYVLYVYPSYVEFAGGFRFSASIFSIDGHLGGFVDADQEKFNLEGKVSACADGIGCLSAAGLVSSTGIAACGPVTLLVKTIYVGVGYRWGDSSPDIMFFSCDLAPYRTPKTTRAVGGSRSFTLPGGLPSAMVKLGGTGDAPKVTITGPHGETLATPDSNFAFDSKLAVVREPKTGETFVGLNKPAAGRWTITEQAGSAPISALSVANGLAPPSIHARVSGAGTARRIVYRVKPEPGQRVTFAERGRDTYNQLGVAKGTHGSLPFTPTFGSGGKRSIVALVERDGLLKHALDVARYDAPPPPLPSRPRGARVRRHGSTLTVTFGRSPGAVRYIVQLKLPDGGRKLVLTRKRSARFRGVDRHLGGRVAVAGLRLDNQAGPRTTARFKRSGRRR